MTSVSATHPAHSSTADGHGHLRLKLKPKGPVSGVVDGGWWPRSRDLAAEVPELIAVLAVRLGSVHRLSYNLDEWATTPRKIVVDGVVVRLGGYHTQPANTIAVLGARGELTLLVVPPETSDQAAHDALLAAGHRGNTDVAEPLLAH